MITPARDPSDPGVVPGQILAGKYRVERVLGAGGMGVVVAAHHLQLDERVALKFLLPSALESEEALARFEREARAAVKIKSEHVARVVDVGKLDNGAPYMVMEYLEGGDLAAMLRGSGKLPVPQAVDFLLQACEAIAEAHSLGIVHRDLKPSNLFCIRRRDGSLSIKVLDFGISKVTGPAGADSRSGDHAMTKTTSVVGSPVYMSPEQMASSKGVDHRTDVWSLGVILYELVAGRVPFDADTVTELAIRIATEPTPPMDVVPPGLPPGFEHVVLRCLDKRREQRFQNVGELAAALVPFGSQRARASLERIQGTLGIAPTTMIAQAPPVFAQGPAPNTGARSLPGWQTDPSTKRGGKAVLGVVLAAFVVVAGASAIVLVTLHRGPATAPAIAPPAASTPGATPASPTLEGSQAPAASSSAPPPLSSAPPPPASSASAGAAATPPAPSPASVRPRAGGPATAPPAAKAQCNPPYYFDAAGNRVFKKECF